MSAWPRCVASTALALVVAAVAPITARAQDSEPPQLTDFSISPTSVTATGIVPVPVTFTVHLTDSTGVSPPCDPYYAPLPKVVIEWPNDTEQVSRRDVYMQRTAGTDQDGTWSATLNMSAGLAGTWTVTSVVAEDAECNLGSTDPATLGVPTTITVTGNHAPHLSMGFRPNPVDSSFPFRVRGRAYYLDTAVGLPNMRVCVAWRWMCSAAADPTDAKFTTTDGDGYYEIAVDPRIEDTQFWLSVLSASLFNPDPAEPDKLRGVVHSIRAKGVPWRPRVSAAATTPTIRLGSNAVVEGKVFGLPSGFSRTVYLQQRGRTAWKTVAAASVRASGRYTLVSQPPVRGGYTYRVAAVPGAHALTGYSASLHVDVS